MQALGAMRYERGVQALTDLFAYFGKGDAGRSGARRAGAHRAPTSVPLFTAQLAEQERGAARRSRSKGWRGSATRRQLPAIQAVARQASAIDGVSLAGAFARGAARNGRSTRSPTRSARAERCASRRSATSSSSRRAGRPPFAHQLLDPDPQIRVDIVDALGLAGDPAAIAVLEPLIERSRIRRSRAPPSAPSRG